ncbi:DsbE family thiol:disulfide interchange protein [Roseitranquillus sediminis]|uniref:DsbE family thiol:disulfide interchange protein n=1 Tax=Roseitranquillus sediminis TaxID=2809051 RepID=UPI001D0CD1AF|nr:DsbE family thiol:disulfide interchange protein [Roseitranquillus sediminis]MBM9594928.1 DsbE family thiol:disulfide interchange protein [Roseitranquillus sediminis]
MARVSALVLVPPVAFLALAAVFFVGMQRDDPDALPSAREGQVAPAIALEPLGERPVFDYAVLQEPGVKLVNYWASWCAPCRAEHPNLELLASEGVPIYGINYKDDPENAEAFLEELGDPYTAIGADASGRTAIDWGLYGVPETYVIDGEGRIVLRFAGPITQRSLEGQIRPAIAKASP